MKIQEIRLLTINLTPKQQVQVKGGSDDNNTSPFIIIDVDQV